MEASQTGLNAAAASRRASGGALPRPCDLAGYRWAMTEQIADKTVRTAVVLELDWDQTKVVLAALAALDASDDVAGIIDALDEFTDDDWPISASRVPDKSTTYALATWPTDPPQG